MCSVANQGLAKHVTETHLETYVVNNQSLFIRITRIENNVM